MYNNIQELYLSYLNEKKTDIPTPNEAFIEGFKWALKIFFNFNTDSSK